MNKQSAWFYGWVVTKAHGLLAHGQKGSDTSGNWLHKGRRGKKGGSLPGGGHKTLGIASGASPDEKKEAVSKQRELRAPIKEGDFARMRNKPEFGGQVVGEDDSWGYKAYKVRTRLGDIYTIPARDTEKISREEAIRTRLTKDEPEAPQVPTFDEQGERDRLLTYTGQQGKLKPGVTRGQVQRFNKRRDAVNAAKQFKYQGGATAYSQVMDAFKRGMTKLAKKPAGRLELSNPDTGMSRLFRRTAATNLIRTLLNIGDFKRNY